MRTIRTLFINCDWLLLGGVMVLTFFGLVTMYTFNDNNIFFYRQLWWTSISLVILFLAMIPDYRFLRSGNTTFLIHLCMTGVLILVLFFGELTLGARSRFDLGFFSLQPSDPAKLVLIAVLAKYFSKRHEIIGDIKHILVSGSYTLLFFGLVFIQPDFGSALIFFLIWLGIVLVSGIRFRHLMVVSLFMLLAFGTMWQFGFQEYQKQRIVTFLNPLTDIEGAGYNVHQSTIAIGSGQVWGKGIGYGTQSKLQFLPEYETDFIFAAFAEEWGFFGVLVLFFIFGVVIWRLLRHATVAASNFERLFASGVAIMFISHFFVHIGTNVGLLPVTGTTIPFLSYGGSHLLIEFLGVAMVIAMSRYAKTTYQAHELLVG